MSRLSCEERMGCLYRAGFCRRDAPCGVRAILPTICPAKVKPKVCRTKATGEKQNFPQSDSASHGQEGLSGDCFEVEGGITEVEEFSNGNDAACRQQSCTAYRCRDLPPMGLLAVPNHEEKGSRLGPRRRRKCLDPFPPTLGSRCKRIRWISTLRDPEISRLGRMEQIRESLFYLFVIRILLKLLLLIIKNNNNNIYYYNIN